MPSEHDLRRREGESDTSARWTGLIAPHDSTDMGFGVRAAPTGPPVVLFLMSVAALAGGLAAAAGRIHLLSVPLALAGVLEILLGHHRLRTDGWCTNEWWTIHRRAAFFLVGLSALRPPRHERRAATTQLLVGFVLLGTALLVFVR